MAKETTIAGTGVRPDPTVIPAEATHVGDPIVEAEPPLLDEYHLDQRSDEFNKGTRTTQLIHEEYNTAHNHSNILAFLKSGRARDLDDEPRVDDIPFFMIGSGGGLDDSIEHLRGWGGGIFCSTSHALTLMHFGIEPTHIVALDPFCSWEEIKGVDWSKTKTKLCIQPGVLPDLFENWPNDFLLFRLDAGDSSSFYATTQMHMFTEREGSRETEWKFKPLLKSSVTLFACSPPAQLFIAEKLGYRGCFCAGMNFAFDTGKKRFTSYSVKVPGKTVAAAGNAPEIEIPPVWDKHESPWEMPKTQVGARATALVCKNRNGGFTDQISIFYMKNWISAWRLSEKPMYTTDKGGSLHGLVPFVPIEEVISTQGQGLKKQSARWIKSVTEQYLATHNSFVLETRLNKDGTRGKQFIETINPFWDIVAFLQQAARQYVCKTCGLGIATNVPAPLPDTERCPRCQTGTFMRQHDFDEMDNIQRVLKLEAWAKKNRPKEEPPKPPADVPQTVDENSGGKPEEPKETKELAPDPVQAGAPPPTDPTAFGITTPLVAITPPMGIP